jgi:hypothetical protein
MYASFPGISALMSGITVKAKVKFAPKQATKPRGGADV